MPRPLCLSRTPLLLALAGALVGCNDTAYPTPPTEEKPTGPFYTVSGVVTDSLTGEGIPGARVSAGKRTALADAAGVWRLDVPDGEAIISSSPANYESGHETITVHSPVYLNLQLRRRAPLVVDCQRDGSMVHAILIDLQGRKSVERWSQSRAIVEAPSGNITLMGQEWSYFPPPDYYQWPIGIPIPDDAVRIKWDVYDNEGYRFLGACEFDSPHD